MNHWINANWPAPAHIKAVTSLRMGGVSIAPYSSLNLSNHVGDKKAAVSINRQQLYDDLRLPNTPIWLQQTHSTRCVNANTLNKHIEADASYSQQKNTVCTILTADCLPILLCSQEGEHIAAIHGGWRGLLAGIIENTLLNMPKNTLMAWLGPAIGPSCFEVGVEVRQAFIKKSLIFVTAFTKKNHVKYWADIYSIARIILMQQGVTNIYGGEYCTVTEIDKFFSYRRDGQTGRMATLIWMR